MNFVNLIIYFAVTFLIFLFVYLFIKSKTNLSLIDQNYNKPQAFHKTPTPRIGGFAGICPELHRFLRQGKGCRIPDPITGNRKIPVSW